MKIIRALSCDECSAKTSVLMEMEIAGIALCLACVTNAMTQLLAANVDYPDESQFLLCSSLIDETKKRLEKQI